MAGTLWSVKMLGSLEQPVITTAGLLDSFVDLGTFDLKANTLNRGSCIRGIAFGEATGDGVLIGFRLQLRVGSTILSNLALGFALGSGFWYEYQMTLRSLGKNAALETLVSYIGGDAASQELLQTSLGITNFDTTVKTDLVLEGKFTGVSDPDRIAQIRGHAALVYGGG